MTKPESLNTANLWGALRAEAEAGLKKEPAMARLFQGQILNHGEFGHALAAVLATRLAGDSDVGLGRDDLFDLFKTGVQDGDIVPSAKKDLVAIMERDPAVTNIRTPFLFFKGFHALQAYRIAHYLWHGGRRDLALYLQSRSSGKFGVDIHPAARFGYGIMMDHASGIVIGETAVVEDDVSMLHGVTLGGTGKDGQERHPKIRKGALIGACATILGNIEIGEGSRVAANSVVLQSVPAHVTVAGIPARIVGKAGSAKPGVTMDQAPECLKTADGKLEQILDFQI